MRVENLPWHRVRLSAKRVRSHVWWIFRGENLVGEVRYEKDSWVAIRGSETTLDDGRKAIIYGDQPNAFPSFRTAVLAISRFTRMGMDDQPEDMGNVRMLRIRVSATWYTVLLKGGERYIYEDFSLPSVGYSGQKLDLKQQAGLKQVLAQVDRWERENL